MKKKIVAAMLLITLVTTILIGCGNAVETGGTVENSQGDTVDTIENVDSKETEESGDVDNLDVEEDDNSSEYIEPVEVEPEVAEDEEVEEELEEVPLNVAVADREFFDYINEQRVSAGLEPFEWDESYIEDLTGDVIDYAETHELPADGLITMGIEVLNFGWDTDYSDWFNRSVGRKSYYLADPQGYAIGSGACVVLYDGEYYFSAFIGKFEDVDTPKTEQSAGVVKNDTTESPKVPEVPEVPTVPETPAVADSGSVASNGGYTFEFEGEGFSGWGNSNQGAVSGITSTPGQSAEAAWDSAKLLSDILTLVNDARADAGLEPLVWDSGLDADALRRAVEISTNFVHENLPANCGENILNDGSGTAQSCFNWWWQSKSHHDNMLYSAYTRISVAVYYDGTSYYASMLLGL